MGIYVTQADETFAPGVACLARSLARHSDVPLVCLDAGLTAQSRRMLAGLGVACRPAEPVSSRYAHPRWEKSWAKLRLFGWEGHKRIIYLDADTVVLGALDELFAAPPARLAACPDLGIQLRHDQFNAGVLVLEPDAATLAGLLASVDAPEYALATDCSDPDWLERHPSDQGFLNLRFGADWARLHPRFNVSKRLYRHHPQLWFELRPHMRVLHFVGHKPWAPASDEPREQGYGPLEALWWEAAMG